MRYAAAALLSLTLLLAGCQSDGHRAQGSWTGRLINQGITVELGKVRIGADYIDLAAIDERYEQLAFVDQDSEVRFGRKNTANFQAKSSNRQLANRYPEGRVVFLDAHHARLRVNKIQGVIELTR